MVTNQGSPRVDLFKPNEVNEQYHEGQETLFYSRLTKKTAKGIIVKRYEHSCLIDFSESQRISAKVKDDLNLRVVVSYKSLKPVPPKAS